MADRPRMKRPVLDRSEPNRAWTGAFRPPGGSDHSEAGSQGPSSPADESSDFGEFAYDAVNNAYRVIDEYLRQGQQMAQGFWMPLADSRSPTPDVNRSTERLMRATGDLAMAWLEAFQQWSTPLGRQRSGTEGPPGPFTAGPPHSNATYGEPVARAADATPSARVDVGLGVSVIVESSRPVTLRVDLQPGADLRALMIGPLTSRDAEAPAITDVELESSAPDQRVIFRIRIPNLQPTGVYNGFVLERETERPRGTLSVSLT